MNNQQSLHVAHWGLLKNNTDLKQLLQTQAKQATDAPKRIHSPRHITHREDFKGVDITTGERHPILVSGHIGLTRTNRLERMQWAVPQALDDIRQWLASEAGQPWQDAPIWLFLPKTENQALLWAIQTAVTQHFKESGQPYPDNLLIIETDTRGVLHQLLADLEQTPQIIIAADSLLDSDYAGRQTDLATTASGDGRILAEAIAWVALTPDTTRTQYHVHLAMTPQTETDNEELNQLIDHCHTWQTQQQYRAGEPVLLQFHLPTSPTHAWQYQNQCLPSSTMPLATKRPKDRQAAKVFDEAIDNVRLIEHNVEQNVLQHILGDAGLANTVAGLVLTLEQLKLAETTRLALVYQESDQTLYHYLIHKEAN